MAIYQKNNIKYNHMRKVREKFWNSPNFLYKIMAMSGCKVKF